jgi:polyribonucleotide nucleotidyltransferase
MIERKYNIAWGGKDVTATFSDLAEQAGGSVMLACDETVVLATACMSSSSKNNPGFFNLTVEYVERFYASGQILGSQWNKREGRPSDQAVLAARIIDRTIRPLFPHHIKNAVQVIVTVLAVGKMDPKVLAVNAASMAICSSPIPFDGPVSAVSITVPKGESDFKINNYLPSVIDPNNEFDLFVCGKNSKVTMIESMAFEYGEEKMGTALDIAMDEIAVLENWQHEILKTESKDKLVFEKFLLPEDLKTAFSQYVKPILDDGLFGANSKKVIKSAQEAWDTIVTDRYAGSENEKDITDAASDYMHDMLDEMFHNGALAMGKRADLREFNEVRSIYAKAGGISPALHGSGIFYRGETHALAVLTLGSPEDRQEVEGIEAKGKKRFMLHYNFPPYSTGETGRMGGMNRREMGHGFLAEKAFYGVLPKAEDFPYTIRVVSEAVASNGSTSQASICAATIAMMDGGVPIARGVAGIAMGLMQDIKDESNYKILTDIQGPEDHYGDMDFKVAGTVNGITAIQLDIKLSGVTPKILKEAMINAKAARIKILDTITNEISSPRADISPRAPKIVSLTILESQIGAVIGPGGKMVNKLRDEYAVEISIEDDGKVFITGHGDGPDRAKAKIAAMTKVYTVGEIIPTATVERITDFGAFVNIAPGEDALLHISEIAPWRVEKVDALLKVGMQFPVQVVKVEMGKIGVSIKALKPDMFPKPEVKTPPVTNSVPKIES